jgi:uncharacterized cupin superfamily protein
VPVIDIDTCPVVEGSRYPSPHDEPCRKKHTRILGQAADLTQFGVNLVRLEPGAWSSQRHWHEHEDEFVWLLEGKVILVTDAGRETLHAGDCAGFKAGVKDGHHFINESAVDALLLVVGTRDDRDHGEYSDIDMRFLAGHYSGTGGYYETKNGKKLG